MKDIPDVAIPNVAIAQTAQSLPAHRMVVDPAPRRGNPLQRAEPFGLLERLLIFAPSFVVKDCMEPSPVRLAL